MVPNSGAAPARGSAAAIAAKRRGRGGGNSTGGAGAGSSPDSNILQFYTDNTTGRKVAPSTIFIMTLGFMIGVFTLHVVNFYSSP